jgi:hypothetical protein
MASTTNTSALVIRVRVGAGAAAGWLGGRGLFELGGQPQVGITLGCRQDAPLLQEVEQREPGCHDQHRKAGDDEFPHLRPSGI